MSKQHKEDFHKKENKFLSQLKNWLRGKHSGLEKRSNLKDVHYKNSKPHMLTIYYLQKSLL